jgi:hypothetical protein
MAIMWVTKALFFAPLANSNVRHAVKRRLLVAYDNPENIFTMVNGAICSGNFSRNII